MCKSYDFKEDIFIKWGLGNKKYPFQYGQIKEIKEDYIRVLRFSDCELAYIFDYENTTIILKDEVIIELKEAVNRISDNIKDSEIRILQLNNGINEAKENIITLESYFKD